MVAWKNGVAGLFACWSIWRVTVERRPLLDPVIASQPPLADRLTFVARIALIRRPIKRIFSSKTRLSSVLIHRHVWLAISGVWRDETGQ